MDAYNVTLLPSSPDIHNTIKSLWMTDLYIISMIHEKICQPLMEEHQTTGMNTWFAKHLATQRHPDTKAPHSVLIDNIQCAQMCKWWGGKLLDWLSFGQDTIEAWVGLAEELHTKAALAVHAFTREEKGMPEHKLKELLHDNPQSHDQTAEETL